MGNLEAESTESLYSQLIIVCETSPNYETIRTLMTMMFLNWDAIMNPPNITIFFYFDTISS
jgi:hypothetical protein